MFCTNFKKVAAILLKIIFKIRVEKKEIEQILSKSYKLVQILIRIIIFATITMDDVIQLMSKDGIII